MLRPVKCQCLYYDRVGAGKRRKSPAVTEIQAENDGYTIGVLRVRLGVV